MNKWITAAALSLELFVGPASQAQQNVPSRPGQAEPDATAAAAHETTLSERLDAIDAGARAHDRSDASLTPEQQHAYNEWVLSYTQRAYAWHQQSTIMIFFMVALVVISGIALAAWQLHAWIVRVKAYDSIFLQRLRDGHDVNQQMVAQLGESQGGEISFKDKALAFSSPYVGVVILGLSMGFFMAYLLYVYPILQGP